LDRSVGMKASPLREWSRLGRAGRAWVITQKPGQLVLAEGAQKRHRSAASRPRAIRHPARSGACCSGHREGVPPTIEGRPRTRAEKSMRAPDWGSTPYKPTSGRCSSGPGNVSAQRAEQIARWAKSATDAEPSWCAVERAPFWWSGRRQPLNWRCGCERDQQDRLHQRPSRRSDPPNSAYRRCRSPVRLSQ